jgi:hypothetical protein
MPYIAKKNFAHGKRRFRKEEVVTDIKGYEEKLLALGLIECVKRETTRTKGDRNP